MPDRPSRQNLVVSKKQSHWPIVIGTITCACVGFGLVWAMGIGRLGNNVIPLPSSPDAAAVVTEPGRFIDPKSHTPSAANESGWQPNPPANPSTADEPIHENPYPAQPASLDIPTEVMPASATAAKLSRFSVSKAEAQQPLNVEPPIGESVEDEPETEIANDLLDPSAEPAPLLPARQSQDPKLAGVEAAELPTVTDIEPPAAFVPPPTAIAPTPPPAVAPPAVVPLNAQALAASKAASPTNTLRPPVMPFAAAPPLVLPEKKEMPADQPTSTQGSGLSGQGRPGPLQLEGVQTPQLTVEKRGPREVQVGKAARYEILVRNVGSAPAQSVTLRDTVPTGTTLIATSPPATPAPTNGEGSSLSAATPSGELIWAIGAMPPGAEARVAMEVMPVAEGEVGSIASVTFRADASVRSRATKPDIRLEASAPKPVLIGKDIQLSIKISNPGTGVATGVVLEGALPEGVTHKAGRELEFDIGQLRPGESRVIDLVLTSVGPGVHSVRLVARADGQIEIDQLVRIEITAPTLELTVEMPMRRYLQRPATCVLSMANAGTASAKGIELAAQLPLGMKFVRANNSGYYDDRQHLVLWSLEELPAAEIGSVEMVVMPIALGPQKIVAAARTANGLSDQASHTGDVEGVAALNFEVTDSEDPIEVDGLTEYVVRIGNQGTKAASGVRLTATLLGDLEPVDAKGPSAHRVENLTILFEPLAKLSPSEEAIFRVRVRGRRAGDQRMQVQLTSDDHPAPITKEEITRVYDDR